MKYFAVTILSSIMIIYTASAFADITVLKVKGTAAYKAGRKWVPLKARMKLREGVKISTGANSYAEVSLNSLNHTVTIKPLTMIQVFSKETKSSTNTSIGLKRGRITAKVPRKERVKTVFKVSTPIATSSVRGTEENISYGPGRGMIIEVIKGVVEGSNRLGRKNLLTARQKFVQQYSQAQALNILQDVRNQALITIYGRGLTAEEIVALLYTDDQTGSPDGDTGILDNQMQQDARVSISIVWP